MSYKVLKQVDESEFRAQLFLNDIGYTLWLIEGDEESSVLCFRTVLGVDIYQKTTGEYNAIMLLRDEEEDFNVEIGHFKKQEEAEQFLVWFKSTLKSFFPK